MELILQAIKSMLRGAMDWNKLRNRPFYDDTASGGKLKKLDKKFIDAVKPDYEQLDPEADDYIKNRPCGYLPPVTKTLVPRSTFQFEKVQDDSYWGYAVGCWEYGALNEAEGWYDLNAYPGNWEILEAVERENCFVNIIWDGKEYRSKIFWNDDYKMVGNKNILSSANADTGEPFLINFFFGEGLLIHTKDSAESHTVEITATVDGGIKKLPLDFMPEHEHPKYTIPISEGGTGAVDATNALKNLGICGIFNRRITSATLDITGDTMVHGNAGRPFMVFITTSANTSTVTLTSIKVGGSRTCKTKGVAVQPNYCYFFYFWGENAYLLGSAPNG